MERLRVAMHDEYSIVTVKNSGTWFVPNKYTYNEGLPWNTEDRPTSSITYARRLLEDFFRGLDPKDYSSSEIIQVVAFDEIDSESYKTVVTFEVESEIFKLLCEGNPNYMDYILGMSYDFLRVLD